MCPLTPTRGSFGNHLASLDGLRAVSILLVIICHGASARGYDNGLLNYWGHLGVSTFFVISGTLITWLMIRESEQTGSLSLSNFYIRRALRILPVFWALILSVIVLRYFHVISIANSDILRALTFTHNYPYGGHREYAFWLTHTWSLSMEEQFYLLWPGLFVLLSRRNAMYFAGIMAFSAPILVLANYKLFPSLRGFEGGMFHTRVSTLMMGCLLAYLLDSPTWRERIKKLPAEPILLASAIYLLVIQRILAAHFQTHLGNAILGLTSPTVEAVAIAAAVLVLVAGRPGIGFAICNQPVVAHIGKLSYGLYIWQQLFYGPSSAPSLFSLLWRTLAI